MPSGGKRKGAGRPKAGLNKFLNVSVDEKTLKKLNELCKVWKCTKSEAVRKAINEAK